MAVTQYIGARYVPIFADPAEWTSTKQYEPLTIVLHQGDSFTSKQFVPVGIDIDNTDYWAKTGNYNAQIEQYREEVLDCVEDVATVNEALLQKGFAFSTVADMQSSDELYVGAICHTNSFYANQDKGGCWYEIVTDVTPNGMDIIKIDGVLRAKMIVTENIIPEQFGAYGDGVEDDTNFVQRCLDVVGCFVSDSLYAITSTINVRPITGAMLNLKVKCISPQILGVRVSGGNTRDTVPHNATLNVCVYGNDVLQNGIEYDNLIGCRCNFYVENFSDVAVNGVHNGLCAENVVSVEAYNWQSANDNFNSVGIITCADEIYTVTCCDVITAVRLRQACEFNVVHSWLSKTYLWENSDSCIFDLGVDIAHKIHANTIIQDTVKSFIRLTSSAIYHLPRVDKYIPQQNVNVATDPNNRSQYLISATSQIANDIKYISEPWIELPFFAYLSNTYKMCNWLVDNNTTIDVSINKKIQPKMAFRINLSELEINSFFGECDDMIFVVNGEYFFATAKRNVFGGAQTRFSNTTGMQVRLSTETLQTYLPWH